MIYLDNAATTYRKPKAVHRAMLQPFGNPGRGGHALSLQAGEVIFECRNRMARLIGANDPTQIIFTNNTTTALNIAIKGAIGEGDHVIISGMEHNSVVRPVYSVTKDVSVAVPDKDGTVAPETVEALIRPNTRMIAVTHASNICGSVNDIAKIGEIARGNNILFLVDAAQTVGVFDINVQHMKIDLLAFAGHKMLFGPQGTGGLYIRNPAEIRPFIEGGTGSASELIEQPLFMPDKFESGTANTSGLAALNEGLKFIERVSTKAIKAREQDLSGLLIRKLQKIDDVKIHGATDKGRRTGVVGFTMKDADSVEVCSKLCKKYKIAARGGLHCAALAHQSLGTMDTGLIRLSVSYFSKRREIRKAVRAVRKIGKEQGTGNK